jgi:hypothetical protein
MATDGLRIPLLYGPNAMIRIPPENYEVRAITKSPQSLRAVEPEAK